ncbi:hypothetical protein FACS1894181_09230 [Bacteroidia bacterium]|nr:hypothetical protein FACS1894181_09230 [Bacteroidia bacterium]
MKKWIYIVCSFIISVSLLNGCLDEPNEPDHIVNGSSPSLIGDSIGVVKANSVEVFAVIAKQNGSSVSEYGFYVIKDGTQDTTLVIGEVEDNATPLRFYAVIAELIPSTTYIVRPYAINREGISLGAELKVQTASGLATVVTRLDSIKGTSAISGGLITAQGESEVTGVGILYSRNENMLSPDTLAATLIADSFSMKITRLDTMTTYYAQAFVVNAYGTHKGEITPFTTSDGKPVVGTLQVLNPQFMDASYSASIISEGDSTIISKGICWTEYPRIPTLEDYKNIDASGDFKGLIDSLNPGVHYNARAYATNTYGTSYSDMADFVTPNNFSSVIVVELLFILDGAAMVRGEIKSPGMGTIVAAGICWATHPEPSLADHYKEEKEIGNVGPFSVAITQLRGNSTYYIRAYAKNSNGQTGYSDTMSIVTPPIFTPVTSFPGSTRLPNSMSFFTNGYIAYLLGGDMGADFTNELWAYNSSDRWDKMAAFPDEPRRWQTPVVISNMAYVFGGVNSANQPTNKLYRYRISDNDWTNINITGTWPGAVHSAAGVPLSRSAYFIGGNRQGTILDEVWVFNTNTPNSAWERKANFPVRQYKGIAVNISNTLYAGLGYTNASGSSYERRLWSLSSSNGTWTEETALPEEALQIRSAVAFKESIYMVDEAGWIWKYDTGTKVWTQKSLLPSSNSGDFQHCMFVLNNYIYIGLGISYKSLIKYDPFWDNI